MRLIREGTHIWCAENLREAWIEHSGNEENYDIRVKALFDSTPVETVATLCHLTNEASEVRACQLACWFIGKLTQWLAYMNTADSPERCSGCEPIFDCTDIIERWVPGSVCRP